MPVLVVGATGSLARLVVAKGLRRGHTVRAPVRDPSLAQILPQEARRIVGNLALPESLSAAVDWKRRGEHSVRASGLPHTIVRSGSAVVALSRCVPTLHELNLRR